MPVTILGPEGRLLKPRVLVLTSNQLRWFFDSPTFLTHVPQLWTLSLRIACQACAKRGLKDIVLVSEHEASWELRCEHRRIYLPKEGTPQDTDDLLARLGWTLACLACAKYGLPDGVEGYNDQQATVWRIRCGCTDRIFHAPTARGVA